MAEINVIARWKAVVYYRSELGLVDVEHRLVEIKELHGFVEKGPHWDTIEKIEITRINHIDGEELTVEEARKL